MLQMAHSNLVFNYEDGDGVEMVALSYLLKHRLSAKNSLIVILASSDNEAKRLYDLFRRIVTGTKITPLLVSSLNSGSKTELTMPELTLSKLRST